MMKELLLFMLTAISVLIFIMFIIYNDKEWGNGDIFLLSLVSLVLIASFMGLLIGLVRTYCWQTTPGTNPTPTTMLTNPPDIGSIEAEFQNEYIPVFPMHQLKPRLDLN